MTFKKKNRLFSAAIAALLLAALAGVYALYVRFYALASDGRLITEAIGKAGELAAVSAGREPGPSDRAQGWETDFRAGYYELGAALSADFAAPENVAAFKRITADYYGLQPAAEAILNARLPETGRTAAWRGLQERVLRVARQLVTASARNTESRNRLLVTAGVSYFSLFLLLLLMQAAYYFSVVDPFLEDLAVLRRKIMRCAAPFPGQQRFADELDELKNGADTLRGMIMSLSEERWRLKKEAETRQLRLKMQNRSLELTRKKVIALVEDLEKARSELQVDKKALKAAGEKLERSNKELEQFAYVASHDLKEPLRIVSSFSGLLAKRYSSKFDSDADDFIRYISEGAQRATDLISALFNYSRVTYTSKAFRNIPAETALQKAMFNLKISIEERGARINWDSLPVIKGDEFQLIQLFQNLISNSLKFNDAPAPEIRVTGELEGGGCTIRFSDNGIGIPPEHRERIFLIFQRLHSQEKYPGTGIGLALCKKITENHGGRIWVESGPGSGSVFCMRFPPTEEAAPAARAAAGLELSDKAGL